MGQAFFYISCGENLAPGRKRAGRPNRSRRCWRCCAQKCCVGSNMMRRVRKFSTNYAVCHHDIWWNRQKQSSCNYLKLSFSWLLFTFQGQAFIWNRLLYKNKDIICIPSGCDIIATTQLPQFKLKKHEFDFACSVISFTLSTGIMLLQLKSFLCRKVFHLIASSGSFDTDWH